MNILIFVGIPVIVLILLIIVTLPRVLESEGERNKPRPIEPQETPRFARDYTGRVWVDKRQKRFFRTIRRRSAPPPGENEE